jgi:MobA/VirD2-like, nuclease domain
MPSPTPPDKVLAAARKFARERFALQRRYAMVLHTDQKHPHVHLVVKAESEDCRRLHIDKEMLRHWREDFARMMTEQGITANTTSRAIRARTPGKTKDSIYRAKQRLASSAVPDRVTDVIRELKSTGTIRDPARSLLAEIRKPIIANWTRTADILAFQDETTLAGEVRYFSRHLPRARTDRERLAAQYLQHVAARRSTSHPVRMYTRQRDEDLTR